MNKRTRTITLLETLCETLGECTRFERAPEGDPVRDNARAIRIANEPLARDLVTLENADHPDVISAVYS